MSLANLLNIDADALECDLAETYHIYDYRGLPPTRAALFSVGLRDDSRVKLKLCGSRAPLETILMTNIVDKLSIMLWQRSGAKESNKPTLLSTTLFKDGMTEPQKSEDIMTFKNGQDFEKARKNFIREVVQNGTS